MAQDTPHSAAAALLDFLVEAPLLTASDKKGVLKLIKGLDPSGFDLIARSGHGISVFRTASCSSNHIYSVTGMGEVAAPPRGVFELLCNFSLIPEWDVLFKGGRYLSYARDPAGCCEVAYLHIVYGLPGVSNLVRDRDFVLRAVRVFFPNGMCVLSCHSVGPEEAAAGGDTGPLPRMIRGQMWQSGYVVVPTSSGCCISVTLQVDPKGWIPTPVINWSLEAIPLNIQRVRAAVERLGPSVMEALPDANMQQGQDCRKRPPLDLLGRLPPGWHTSGLRGGAGGRRGAATATAAATSAEECVGGGEVGVGGEGWWGGGRWGLGSSLARSFGSSCSLQGSGHEASEGGEDGEAAEWHDAQE